jgi:hypothetical protein
MPNPTDRDQRGGYTLLAYAVNVAADAQAITPAERDELLAEIRDQYATRTGVTQ